MNACPVYLIDDDAAVRDALAWLLRSCGIGSQLYASAEEFLASYQPTMSGVIVLDIRMEGMSGLELFDRLLTLECPMPVIFLTGHGDVPQAVQALKKGAFDFLEKPFDENELTERVKAAISREAGRRGRAQEVANIADRLEGLTEREREIMTRIVAGKLNKVIADELQIAVRTVEVHRARIFSKMGVRSAVELAGLLAGRTAI
ncbi:MAG: response regulator transcription factor [Rhodocyclaceae bacterium]|nr:response regulator transcription factor [Rhodocyclaceae bacterium]MBK6907176.1 response regulator transcription factor [Rhodocyclaceae bacterium]